MNGFEVIDISGDVGYRVWGETIEGLFVSAAKGFYTFITSVDEVNEIERLDIEVSGEPLEVLLIRWLNELIFVFETKGFVAKEIEILHMTDKIVKAKLSGEEFDPDKHERGLSIKAATYHNLNIENKKGIWDAVVIFDV